MNITKILAKINQSKVNFGSLYMCMGQMVKCLFSLQSRLGVIKNRQKACPLQILVSCKAIFLPNLKPQFDFIELLEPIKDDR